MTFRKFLWLAIRSSVAFRLCQLEDESSPPPSPFSTARTHDPRLTGPSPWTRTAPLLPRLPPFPG